MKYTKENIVEGINAKLDLMIEKDKILRGACNAFRDIITQYPIEVEQNVLEWINGDPLTDINYHGFSIAKTMKELELHESFFMLIIRNLICYRDSGFKNISICYEML